MFDPKGFAPIQVIGPPKFPRVFGYANEEDLLSEIMAPGYFNSSKIILRPNSFIKVICKNAIAEIVVESNVGDVTMKDEFFRATDPYIELKKSPRRPRRTKTQMQADKEKNEPLAETG